MLVPPLYSQPYIAVPLSLHHWYRRRIRQHLLLLGVMWTFVTVPDCLLFIGPRFWAVAAWLHRVGLVVVDRACCRWPVVMLVSCLLQSALCHSFAIPHGGNFAAMWVVIIKHRLLGFGRVLIPPGSILWKIHEALITWIWNCWNNIIRYVVLWVTVNMLYLHYTEKTLPDTAYQ